MPDPLRSRWTRLALVGVMLAPLGIGLWLEANELIGTGAVFLFLVVPGLYGYEWQRLQRGQEVRESIQRVVAEKRREA